MKIDEEISVIQLNINFLMSSMIGMQNLYHKAQYDVTRFLQVV